MKKLLRAGIIILFAILFALSGHAQKLKGDTLVIPYSEAIKYIQIGSSVYEIKSPTLELAPPKIDNAPWWRGGTLTPTLQYFNGNNVPAVYSDTTTTFMRPTILK